MRCGSWDLSDGSHGEDLVESVSDHLENAGERVQKVLPR